VTVYTHLGPTPIGWVILINCLLFIGITSRMISASALLSAVPAPADRGAYMSISSSLQQVSGGFAAIVAGLIVTETSTGALEHFDTVGYVLAATILITTTLIYFISRRVEAMVSTTSTATPATTVPAYSPSGTGPTRARP
jgi:MFS family permease